MARIKKSYSDGEAEISDAAGRNAWPAGTGVVHTADAAPPSIRADSWRLRIFVLQNVV